MELEMYVICPSIPPETREKLRQELEETGNKIIAGFKALGASCSELVDSFEELDKAARQAVEGVDSFAIHVGTVKNFSVELALEEDRESLDRKLSVALAPFFMPRMEALQLRDFKEVYTSKGPRTGKEPWQGVGKRKKPRR